MFSSAEKTTSHATAVQQKAAGNTFFRKAGGESFFGAKETPSFFSAGVQAKLTVSQPDDPQEKEADAMADKVMRMPEPAAATAGANKEEEKLHRKEDEEVQPKNGSEVISSVQRKEEAGQVVQAKRIANIQRSANEETAETAISADANSNSDSFISRKNIPLHHSDVIQRSGRGPPTGSIPFEQHLSSSKGAGAALPGDTRQFMESRFSADFGGVRIHTGSQAENLSRNIHAHAFTHGSDIYFNSGKFSPGTAEGNTLLAHELTHTIQQGAVKHNQTTTGSNTTVARKNIIQRSAGNVPAQLTNAVTKAKSQEGKINANKEGPDGYRDGWQQLVEIFKSTFGEDKVVSGSGGTSVPGTVSEMDIKKYRKAEGDVIDPVTKKAVPNQKRDAMPSWCGIFVFWALNKSGVPMPKWQLGKNVLKPESLKPAGTTPEPGDIAWKKDYSHFAIVESVNGDTIRSVNGNTSGEDNLGGQVQSREHPMSNWTAFFNPLLTMDGTLGTGEGPSNEKPKSMRELRKEMFHVDRKDDSTEQHADHEEVIQPKQAMSNWSVDTAGKLNTNNSSSTQVIENKIQPKEEEKKEEDEQQHAQASMLNRKEMQSLHCDACDSKHEATTAAGHPVQRQIDHTNSSLNGYENASISMQGNEQDRGPPSISMQGSESVQRSVIDDALNFAGSVTDCISLDLDVAKRCALQKAQQVAMHIPGYKALRVVLGEDPITGENVERNGRNFIEAAFDIMPGGSLLHQKLDEQHQLDAAAEWIDRQISTVESLVNGLFTAVDRFWDGLGVSDLASPMDVLRDGANIVLGFIDSVIRFAVDAAAELLKMIKDYLLAKIVEFIKEQTPAYPLLTVILGKDPITDVEVVRNGTNILNALLELGGEEGIQQRTQMQETGTFQKAAAFIDEGIAIFSGAYDRIVQGFKNIWDHVSIDSLMDPVGTFQMIYNEFAEPVSQVLDFVLRVGAEILKFIKEVLMTRLSAWARTVRGYYLVTVIIGKDPFTDALVPFTMENVIHGFMSLMEGGEEQFAQMKESGAIDRTTKKITAAVARLNMTPEAIVQLFIDLWNSFSINDLADPIGAFQRIIATFGEPIGRLIAFVIEIIKIVIMTILEIMQFPFDLINNIIAKAMLAFELIKADPIGFLKNLLRAIKQGFVQFFDNIIKHLLAGLVGWLTSELKDAGVAAPEDLSLKGIISWVLQILGVSMEKIWEKLAAHPRIGPAKVAKIRSMINTLEGIWTFIKDVQERGIAAIWDKIKEQLNNLWDTVLGAIKNWIMEKIVSQIVTKLLSMLDPTGIMAVVNSCIALYKAIQSFIKYLRQMLEIVNSFVEGVAEIASGNTKKAADFLERTLARGVPIVIGFLANQVGLGGLGKKVGEMIESVRKLVDDALTWLVNKAVDTGFAIFDRLMSLGRSAVEGVKAALGLEETYTNEAGENHSLVVERNQSSLGIKRASGTPLPITDFLTAKTNEINNPASTLTNEQKTEMRTAIGEAQGIINSIQAISYPADAPEATTKHIQQQANTLLAQLKRQVQLIDKGAAPVPPVTVTPGFSANLASTLNVKYLLKGHHPPGTPAGDYGGEMHGATPILQSIGLLPLKWVNFHLLNHNYGGLAVDSNLVPTPKGVNSNYLSAFEEPFKGKYDDPTGPKVMWFNCSIVYRSGTVFAQSVSSQGGAMKPDGRNWIPDPALQIPPWSSEVPEPVADAVFINQLPRAQTAVEALAKYTPISRGLLVLLARIKPRVVMGKSTLLSVLDTYARSTAMDPGTYETYIGQINATTFDFSTGP